MSWSCGKQHCPTHSSPEHQCPGWALASIKGSVGAGGTNNPADVRIVQGGLNRLVDAEVQMARFNTDGQVSPNMIDAIKRFQRNALGLDKPDGRIDPGGKTFQALAKSLKLRRITVSLRDQTLVAYEDGRAIFRFDCVTGAEDHPTEPGTFKIFRKNREYRSKAYDAQMNYAMFFSKDGKAIHQYHGPMGLTVVRMVKRNVSDWFGSHGCVRLDEENARKIFDWTPMQTVVHIF